MCLIEAQTLCDRVTEIEKSLGPKPLQTIPLPKPLAEQSWMSLAETVIYLHQYISDNEMVRENIQGSIKYYAEPVCSNFVESFYYDRHEQMHESIF